MVYKHDINRVKLNSVSSFTRVEMWIESKDLLVMMNSKLYSKFVSHTYKNEQIAKIGHIVIKNIKETMKLGE